MLTELGKERIRALSDSDLVEYVQMGTGMYLPEAIDYAQEELQRRELSEAHIAELCYEADERIAAKEAFAVEIASRPLGSGGKVGAFLLGFFGFCTGYHFIIHLLARDHPENRRAEDWQRYELIGFGSFWAAAFVVAIIFAILKIAANKP